MGEQSVDVYHLEFARSRMFTCQGRPIFSLTYTNILPGIGLSTYDSQIVTERGMGVKKVPGEERERKHGYICEKSRIVMMGGTPKSFPKTR